MSDSTDPHEPVTEIARAIGKVQACTLKKEPTAPKLMKDKTTPLEAYSEMFEGLLDLDNSDQTKELVEKIVRLVPEYYGAHGARNIHQKMGFRPVLVHGDLRTENVLIDKDTGDLAALINWQCSHLGVGVEDLHRIAMFALTTEKRRSSTPMLVEEKYNSLVKSMDGTEPPYSLETLLILSDIMFPHCAFFFAGDSIAMIMNQMKDPRISDDDKEKRKEVVLDKAIGAFEDVLELDIKNLKHPEHLQFF